jgi:DNA-binding beta-propeller fold protein YncE
MCPLWRALAKRDIETKKGPFAQFYCPSEVSVDGYGNILVTDKGNHCIRKITPQGHVSTLAGTDKEGHRDGDGTIAQFNCPSGIAVDGGGNVIVADALNNRIRMITPQGHVSTLAGIGERGHRDGDQLALAQFDCPHRVAMDANGHIVVAAQ